MSSFVGLDHIEVTIPPDLINTRECNTSWLMQKLVASYPDLEPFVPTVKLAYNKKYIRHEVELRAGAEIALIPPISGG